MQQDGSVVNMPPADVGCPIPEVAEALGPYIKPRHEVTALRESLRLYLESHLSLEDGQNLSPMNLEDPPHGRLEDSPASLTGVHRAYYNALAAHQAATARLRALKAEVAAANLQYESSLDVAKMEELSTKNHILPLLHQKERRRKLQIVERAFHDTKSAASDVVDTPLDEMVRNIIGEQPIIPTIGLPPVERGSDVDERILDLKRAIIAAKHEGDEAEIKDFASNKRDGPPTDDAQLAALRQAHRVLVKWIEDKLATIADAEAAGEADDQANTTLLNGDSRDEIASTQDIDALYQQYLTSRRRLIHNIQNCSSDESAQTANSAAVATTPIAPRKENEKMPPSVTVLSYLPHLTSLKEEEASLAQQSLFMRRQLAGAETETDLLLSRLADESHLVHPGASRARDWRAAAADANRDMNEFFSSRVQAGRNAIEEATRVLGKVQDVPKALERAIEAG